MSRKSYTGYSAVKNNTCRNHRGNPTVDLVIDIPWEGAQRGDPLYVSQYIDNDGDECERLSARPHENSVPRQIPYQRGERCFVKHMCQFDDMPTRKRNLGPAKAYWHGHKDFSVKLRDQGGHVTVPPRQRNTEARDPHTNLMR